MKTYTFARTNPLHFLQDALRLYKMKSENIEGQASGTIDWMRQFESRTLEATGITLVNKRILIIGPGQTPREMIYLGIRNEVVGIDLDVIPHGLDLKAYLQMLKSNGLLRTVKTVARKSLGIDSRYEKAMCKLLEVPRPPKSTHLQMNAEEMTFPDQSFDFVYSFSVFEHLPAPEKVVGEICRVLKPGGGAYLSLHLYTSDNGCHDIGVFSGKRDHIPYWSHLRPEHKSLISPNAYLNEMRIPQWRALYEAAMPGMKLLMDQDGPEKAEPFKKELSDIRKNGGLQDYSDDELLTYNLISIWQKPA